MKYFIDYIYSYMLSMESGVSGTDQILIYGVVASFGSLQQISWKKSSSQLITF
jgi:hypothetical protein